MKKFLPPQTKRFDFQSNLKREEKLNCDFYFFKKDFISTVNSKPFPWKLYNYRKKFHEIIEIEILFLLQIDILFSKLHFVE